MSKINLQDVGSGFNLSTIVNDNNGVIEEAFDNTLSRDGSTPNQMNAALDMNSNKIINLGAPSSGSDAARWTDVTNGVTLTGVAVPSLTGNADKALFTDGATLAFRKTPYIARTAAENTASITPTDFSYAEGNVKRYGATGDGSTNDAASFQAAINVALAAVGSGKNGCEIFIPVGAYSIATALTFGGVSNLMIPITIRGTGWGSQIINNITAGSSATFNMTGKNGWTIKDLLICGNSAHKNDGILVSGSGATAIRWRIENVICMVAGYGLKISNSNTGSVTNYRGWPNNPPDLKVAQTVTLTDVLHHIYLTGTFANDITFKDCDCLPYTGFVANHNGLKLDSTFAYGISIIGGSFETNNGANTETGILINPGSTCQGLWIAGVYNEGTKIDIRNTVSSVIGPVMSGGTGGSILLSFNSQANTIIGGGNAVLNIQDVSCTGNLVLGSGFASITDATEAVNQSGQPTRYIGQRDMVDRGRNWRKLLPYAATMNPDAKAANHYVVRVGNTSPMTINLPSNPSNGQDITFTIRNESGGAMGVITWSGYHIAGWTNPANGTNRTVTFYYDSDFSAWYVKTITTNDVSN